MHKDLPCINCPVFAICKWKKRIECEILVEYFKKDPKPINIVDIRSVLPNFQSVTIYTSNRQFSYYVPKDISIGKYNLGFCVYHYESKDMSIRRCHTGNKENV